MADTFTARTETSEESLEAAGLEVVVAAATTEAAREAQGLDVVVAATTTDTHSTDDVWIDGNIITAENYDAALSQDGNDLLIVNNGDGSDFLEGGEGNDTVQVNGVNHDSDIVLAAPNGKDVVVESGRGSPGQIASEEGESSLEGGSGTDTVQVNGADGAGDDFSISPNGQRASTPGQDGPDLLIVNNGDGSDFLEGGAGNDFVQVNGANGAGDDFSIDPNGERVRDGGEGIDVLTGGNGVDQLSGDTLVFVDLGKDDRAMMAGEFLDLDDQDYGEAASSNGVHTDIISLNYEEIDVAGGSGFDAVFDAV